MCMSKLKKAFWVIALSNICMLPANAVSLLQAYQAALKNDAGYRAAKAENNARKEIPLFMCMVFKKLS